MLRLALSATLALITWAYVVISFGATLTGTCTATWNKNTEPDLSFYTVKVGPSTGSYSSFVKVPAPTSQATCEQLGIKYSGQYFLTVSASDTSLNESNNSAEVNFSFIGVAPPSGLPLLLWGTVLPEEGTVTIPLASIPAGATKAVLKATINDPDNPEGELYVNGNKIADLFNPAYPDASTQDITWEFSPSFVKVGDNIVKFRHTATGGYEVRALDLSIVAPVTPPPSPPPPAPVPPPPPPVVNPGTVTNITVTPALTSAQVSFPPVDDGTGQPAKYDLRYAVAPLNWGTGQHGTCTVDGTCTISGLTQNTKYEFQVVAYRGTLNVDAVFGALSALTSFTTLKEVIVPPPPPVGLKSPFEFYVRRLDPALIEIGWVPATCTEKYKIYYFASGQWVSPAGWETTNSYFRTQPPTGRRTYRVSAFCADGTEWWINAGVWGTQGLEEVQR